MSQRQNFGGHGKQRDRALHRDWRVSVAAIVMLLAMLIYVLTLDESTGLTFLRSSHEQRA